MSGDAGTTDEHPWTPESHPSVPIAFDLSKESYSLMVGRFDALEARLQYLQTLAATMTFAAPTLARAVSPDADLKAVPAIVALALFVVVILASTLLRLAGNPIVVPDPKTYYTGGWTEVSEFSFKRHYLRDAGTHFDKNVHTLLAKYKCAAVVTALL